MTDSINTILIALHKAAHRMNGREASRCKWKRSAFSMLELRHDLVHPDRPAHVLGKKHYNSQKAVRTRGSRPFFSPLPPAFVWEGCDSETCAPGTPREGPVWRAPLATHCLTKDQRSRRNIKQSKQNIWQKINKTSDLSKGFLLHTSKSTV